ncbi:C4-dicarboxylate transporter DcuC [Sutterella massiliensis]|uniref:C4-dicarboxylate transporter DcuC n=1 Tax=Sutterella massiliensis TaxID=1816689 RepID=A0ABS2DST5_9BURK|nr:C4-dicarboxylate transporter DcuC [Sutterella massiliensis]MBM6704406.1 C4-dicarboxylate transporter DcuC [Sutterella massiliensis]
MLEAVLCLIALVLAGWAIAKNYDAKVVLFVTGLILLYLAVLLGHPVLAAKASSGLSWVDPFKVVRDLFVKQYSNAGLIILTLFGFAAYMSHIGANQKVIEVLSKPLSGIRSPYILVPLVFWLGTLLSIIIPSAASLAVILMATLYPVLRAAKMTPLTAAGVIATTATIVPTPLGGDNVVAARVLGFEHVVDYVFYHHAPITIPAIIIMGFAHYFWQRYMDKKSPASGEMSLDESKLKQNVEAPTYYAIFPVLPLILTIFFWLFFKSAKVGLVEITLFSFALAFACEIVRRRNDPTTNGKKLLGDANLFFKGMGDGFSKVVVLIVAASTMVAGLSSMGLIDMISNSLQGVESADTGLMFAFSGITGLITFISGSGNAVFYSFIELIPQIAEKAGIDPIMVALPMQCTSNLIRAVSPVAAVVIIVAATIRENPLNIVKRTAVPLLVGEAAVLAIAFFRYL